jgi:hypothetical protein
MLPDPGGCARLFRKHWAYSDGMESLPSLLVHSCADFCLVVTCSVSADRSFSCRAGPSVQQPPSGRHANCYNGRYGRAVHSHGASHLHCSRVRLRTQFLTVGCFCGRTFSGRCRAAPPLCLSITMRQAHFRDTVGSRFLFLAAVVIAVRLGLCRTSSRWLDCMCRPI